MSVEFEMMVLKVCQTVRHVFFASLYRLLPEWNAVSFDADFTPDRAELRPNNQLWADAALAELGACKVQIVAPLEAVIGKFVPGTHAKAIWAAVARNEIYPCDFCLFT